MTEIPILPNFHNVEQGNAQILKQGLIRVHRQQHIRNDKCLNQITRVFKFCAIPLEYELVRVSTHSSKLILATPQPSLVGVSTVLKDFTSRFLEVEDSLTSD
jgi:hypothetical protein